MWGWNINGRGGLSYVSGADAIAEAIWIILATPPKSRIMEPEFGCGIHRYVFAPNEPNTRATIVREVEQALLRWEPRIDVLDVRVESDPDAANTLLVQVDYRIRANNAFMVSAGSVAPAVLPVREDLRTRMGWGLVYQIHGLTDEEKLATLTQMAEARGLTLSPGVLPYLLSHFQRDMVSLSSMLDSLDQYSLETKRPITLPLLREWLQEEAKE